MPDSAKADHPLPASAFSLWLGILGGPTAWLVQFQLRYMLVRWACAAGHAWSIHLSGLVFLLCSFALAWLSWRNFRLLSTDPQDESRAFARGRFMALLGIGLSSLFALVIAGQGAAVFLIDPCSH
jgi:hypothetical protein